MPKGDDILLGASIAPSTDSDSDGDGVSDAQERLDGTDPGDATDRSVRDPALKPDAMDPRGDLDRVTLEREVGFDPTANMPEGMSVDSGLKGLTNVDGSALPTGTNRHGIGEDSILDGRLGANSPLDMLKDAADGGDGPNGTAGLPPAGADLGSRGPKWDLVGGKGDTEPDEFELPGAIKPTTTPPPPMADPPPPPPDAERQPPPPPKPEGEDPDPDPEPGPVPLQTDPDAGGNSGVNVGGGGVPIIIDGPRVVEGHGGAPKIEGDEPPVRYRDLVTDPGDESGGISVATGDAPRGAPDAPLIHTINPDSGVVQPPTGGPPPSGGGGGDDLYGSSSAATATTADITGAPSISPAGSGGGAGIGSVAPAAAAETPDLVAGLRDPSIRPLGNVGAQHGVPDPVDRFASEYLQDASLDASGLVSTGLAADLGADPVPVADAGVRRPDELDVDEPDGFADLDRDDPLDP